MRPNVYCLIVPLEEGSDDSLPRLVVDAIAGKDVLVEDFARRNFFFQSNVRLVVNWQLITFVIK